jgi:phospholipid transport system transporter-binding protein
VQLPATATIAEACELLGQLGAGPERVDASALTSLDTSTIALLLEARRRAQARGAAFGVVGAPPKLRELARLYGVEELLALSESPPGPASAT